jgi:hypothetical protein
MNPLSTSTNRPSCALPLGFAFIYLAWGGTYLGVKFAIVDFPVFLMSGSRFSAWHSLTAPTFAAARCGNGRMQR